MPEHSPAILVVEDDPDVRRTISDMLTGSGFQVETVGTGLEALAIIEERPFDLLVADIQLPGGISGLAMTQCARIRHPALKCLFISGQRAPVVCDPELDDFMAKPFRAYELIGCVWKVLRGNLPRPRVERCR
ncbi:MAG TPA: response regulator [Stellaceae bacterium]|nr:response regulator [Stellaceae bacterium]